MRRVLISLAAVLAFGVAASLAAIWYVGAWRLVFPNRTHETAAPAVPADLARPAVLVFTKTNAFRHADAIEVGSRRLEEIARSRGFGYFHTENGAAFEPALLSRFDAVVFLNATGAMLSEDQEAAFESFIESGGGWMGIHAAGDGSHAGWRWYVETLIGSDYLSHIMGPQFQEARVVVEDREHPATRHLPQTWQHSEEWYSWERSPRVGGVSVLATVDESSYSPWRKMWGDELDLRMGDHPVVWHRCVGRGRIFYSALGHAGETYDRPEVLGMLEGALAWTLRSEGSGCEGGGAARVD